MSLESFLKNARRSFYLDDIPEIRALTLEHPPESRDFELLIKRFNEAISMGRRGKALNLLVLGVLWNEAKMLMLIRRHGLFRASRYDLEPVIPRYLTSALLSKRADLRLSDTTADYLHSVAEMLAIAPEVRALQRGLLRRLRKEAAHILPCLLRTLEFVFMENLAVGTEYVQKDDEVLARPPAYPQEDLAEGFSYLFFLYTQSLGFDASSMRGLNTDAVIRGEYLPPLIDATRIRMHREWEILVDAFDFECRFDSAIQVLTITPRDLDLEKSIRLGFLQSGQREAIALAEQDKEAGMLMRDVGVSMPASVRNSMVIRADRPYPRLILRVPEEPIRKLLRDGGYFREEVAHLAVTLSDHLVGFDDLMNFELSPGTTVKELLLVQRLLGFTAECMKTSLRALIESEPSVVFNSLIPSFSHDHLKQIIGIVLEPARADALISLLVWKNEDGRLFDIQSQPLIQGEPAYFMPTYVLAYSDLLRNLLWITRSRMQASGVDVLPVHLKEALQGNVDVVESHVGYKFGSTSGEIDVLAISGEYIFAFECKTSLLPCSTHELRTTYDHIRNGVEQLARFRELISDPRFRAQMSKKIGCAILPSMRVIPCVVVSNRMFVGYRMSGTAIRGFYELANFITTGIIKILGQEVPVRKEGSLEARDLAAFIEADTLHRPMFESMEPVTHSYKIGGSRVALESVALDSGKVCKMFGVNFVERIQEQVKDMQQRNSNRTGGIRERWQNILSTADT
jgi:hypothetical protein